MNRDVFFLEDLLKSQMAQPHHQGYQVVTYIKKILPSGSQEDGALRGFSITERVERPDGGDACLLGEEENVLAANSCFCKVKVNR